MKAKVKDSGEIIEVKEWSGASDVIYSTPDMNMFYAAYELEIIPDTHAEVTIEGWVARDKDNDLWFFDEEPVRVADCIWATEFTRTEALRLSLNLFPEVTWHTEPKRVRITITPIEELQTKKENWPRNTA